MAGKTVKVPTSLIAALAAVLVLAILNPNLADFKAYYQKQASASARKNTKGAAGNLLGSIAKGAAGIVADSSFKRTNLLVGSLYQSKARDGSVQKAYLGLAKLFIKLK
ncbi:MAG: hypothetical protein JNG85_05395 [Spirochaetaceae bacterium]|nr:hypothetical protein [Spirochaetaceae bacterium]